jgi:S1-C subfamily serine protease
LGAEFTELSAAEKRDLGIENGVKVNKISDGKIGKETDMREGFIITKMGGQPVKSIEDFTKKLQNAKNGVFLSGVYPDVEGEFYYAFGL